jgi:hypothetical protein
VCRPQRREATWPSDPLADHAALVQRIRLQATLAGVSPVLLRAGDITPVAPAEPGLGGSVRNTRLAWFGRLGCQPSGPDEQAGRLEGFGRCVAPPFCRARGVVAAAVALGMDHT